MPKTSLLCGVRKRSLSRGGSQGKGNSSSNDSWYVEQAFVFGDIDVDVGIDTDTDTDMRRSSARSHWDTDASLDHPHPHQHQHRENLSPRSQQLHDDVMHLLPLAADDMLGVGDHAGGGGMGAAGGIEAGIHIASPRAGAIGADGSGGVGGVGGAGASPRHRDGGGGGGGGGGGLGRKRGKGGRRRFFLRIHKFVFQTELALHLSMCILSIAIPFSLSGSPWLAAIPVSVWCFYNAMFVMGAKRASTVLPGFDRFKRSFVAAMEEFLPPRLLPVLSLSFLSVVIAVTLTAARLGGPPLCISSCRTCLGSWRHAHPVAPLMMADVVGASGDAGETQASPRLAGTLSGSHRLLESAVGASRGGGFMGVSAVDAAAAVRGSLRSKNGEACGYANGKELLAYYTVSQSAILIYLAVMTGLLTCLAWKVSEEELAQRQAAESRLKAQNPRAFELRERMILEHGRPGSSVRPETTCPWLMFGLVAACTFTLIGWRKWGDLPLTVATVIVVMANVTTTLASVLMLHVGFHGRLIALYQGNLHRVQFLSKLLREGTGKGEEPWVHAAEAWWCLRSFVLREDLSLDYDVGGLGVSATFLIVLASFVVAIAQIVREGRDAMLNPPGSYCAYASVYLTVCLIRIFGLATKTYLEQQLHVGIIQEYMDNLASVASKIKMTTNGASFPSGLKKERGQPSSPAASLTGSRNSGTKPTARTAATAGTAAAIKSTGDTQSQQNASALARVAFTGTSILGIRAGGSSRDDLDGGVVAGEAGGAEARHTSGGTAGGVGRTGAQRVDDGEALYPGQDAMRRMIVHINTLDPYPCVLGVPVKPALFATSKVYVFVCFAAISVMLMYDVVCDMV